MNKQELLRKLELDDAFLNFEPRKDAQLMGWNFQSPIFQELIETLKPKLIIEVGTWMGASAFVMTQILKHYGLSTPIICVDTWLGSLEYWRSKEAQQENQLHLVHGYPSLYLYFLSNMLNNGSADHIVPLPLPSLIAARLLKEKNITADLIYIDASHDEKDVYDDIVAYWEVLAVGGVMFGDDWQWESVQNAVLRFVQEKNLDLQCGDVKWTLQKTQ